MKKQNRVKTCLRHGTSDGTPLPSQGPGAASNSFGCAQTVYCPGPVYWLNLTRPQPYPHTWYTSTNVVDVWRFCDVSL